MFPVNFQIVSLDMDKIDSELDAQGDTQNSHPSDLRGRKSERRRKTSPAAISNDAQEFDETIPVEDNNLESLTGKDGSILATWVYYARLGSK